MNIQLEIQRLMEQFEKIDQEEERAMDAVRATHDIKREYLHHQEQLIQDRCGVEIGHVFVDNGWSEVCQVCGKEILY